MKVNFRLYLFICWITHPFRKMIPGYRHEYFAIKLLFWNPYKTRWVTGQAMHESANFSSNLYTQTKNCFGMGKTKNSPYQLDTVYLTPDSPEPDFGHYKSVYHSVYCYYDSVYRRVKSRGVAIDEVNHLPPINYDEANYKSYIQKTALTFKTSGYFTADPYKYAIAVTAHRNADNNSAWRYILNWVLLCVVPVSLYILYRVVRGKGVPKWAMIRLSSN